MQQSKLPNTPEWLEEKAAAKMLNYQPRTLRKYAKSGRLPVAYTSLFGRKFFYDKNSIQKILMESAA